MKARSPKLRFAGQSGHEVRFLGGFTSRGSRYLLLSATSLCLLVLLPSTSSMSQQDRTATGDAPDGGTVAEKLKIAEEYERKIADDPSQKAFLAVMLVKVYAEAGQTNKALAWADEVMKTNPDPQAYIAGVHAMLGSYDEAESILSNEISSAKQPRRKMMLCWQLADVCTKNGKDDKAEELLQRAFDLAKGTPDESASKKRLDGFRKRRKVPKAADANSGP